MVSPTNAMLTNRTAQTHATFPDMATLLDLYGTTPPAPALSDSDVQRIASAVADELDRRASHPLRVTAADVRRWIPR